MTDAIKYIDVDDEQFEDAPKALRDAYKALARQHKEASSALDGARKTIASHALGDVLGTAGFKNPKRVEQDILRDGIDATDKTAVEAWLADNADDYAKAEGSSGEPAPVVQTKTPEQQAAEAALAAQYAALRGGEQLAAAADMSKWELAQSEITKDMTGEQIIEVYTKHGI